MQYTGETYSLTWAEDRPYVYLDSAEGTRLAELFVLSSVHGTGGLDDTTDVGQWMVEERDGARCFSLEARSSIWESKEYRFRCSPRRLLYEVSVAGEGSVLDVSYFGGYCSAFPRWGSGFLSSGHGFEEGFNPEPNSEHRWCFSPTSSATIDLTGAPLPGKRHWFFTPGPFCFAFRCGATWLGLGLEARPGTNVYNGLRYLGGDAFFLQLDYGGNARVDGRYELPSIGFDFGASRLGAVRAHASALRESGAAPDAVSRSAAWWARPIFCGWGAQCAMAALQAGYAPEGDPAHDGPAFLNTMSRASAFARQEVYEGFLAHLARHDVVPGTITIDDKWQRTYGGNEVDVEKWPDLTGFVRRRHDASQHVLLWLKAWDVEGVAADECIRNAVGLPLAVDPTNPRYEARLRASVRRMLSPDEYDADGFKIDFTHRIPVGPALVAYDPLRGLELMKRYLGIIHDEAKKVKLDALVVAHTPHPYLADVLDMVRLNDMLDLTRLSDPEAGTDIERTVTARARVAGIACPGALIDTDNWPVRDRESWRAYMRVQPSLGVPALYFVDRIDVTQESLESEDYDLVRETWSAYETARVKDNIDEQPWNGRERPGHPSGSPGAT